MATITVTYDGSELIMSDNGHTNASKSEVIHWHPGDGVEAITDVLAKSNTPTSTNKFWKDAPKQNGVNFKGKIDSDLADDQTWDWDYDITCNVGTKENPVFKIKDPRIQVFSR